MMNILITGASGFIGARLIIALREHHCIKACIRNPAKLRWIDFDVETVEGDFAKLRDVENWLPILTGIDAVINCVGIIDENRTRRFEEMHTIAPCALFEAAQRSGVRKVIQISALGADADARSRYHLSKKAADDFLRKLDLDWFILRPSIVYGPGAQSMALFQAIAALPVHVVPDGGRQPIQPVHVDDLVAAVEACLDEKGEARQTIDVVGPDAIDLVDLLKRLRTRLGKTAAATISVDSRLASRFGFVGKILQIPALSTEGISMLMRGNVADPGPMSRLLGRKPASLEAKLCNRPATQAERWHAGLFFLRPLLRFAIALVWIWSGVVSAFIYPPAQSYAWLDSLGITGSGAPLSLYGLSLMDLFLGLALLFGYRLRLVVTLQIIAMLGYMLVIAVGLPEFWLHPFGPVIKNVPILVASLILLVLEEEKP